MSVEYVTAPTYNYDDPPGAVGTYEVDEDGVFSCCSCSGYHDAECQFTPEDEYDDDGNCRHAECYGDCEAEG